MCIFLLVLYSNFVFFFSAFCYRLTGRKYEINFWFTLEFSNVGLSQTFTTQKRRRKINPMEIVMAKENPVCRFMRLFFIDKTAPKKGSEWTAINFNWIEPTCVHIISMIINDVAEKWLKSKRNFRPKISSVFVLVELSKIIFLSRKLLLIIFVCAEVKK